MSMEADVADQELALLTAAVKLFLLRPAAGAEIVPRVLQWATAETDHVRLPQTWPSERLISLCQPDLRDRGFFYWRLLSYNNTALAKQIVMGEKPTITAESEKLDPVTLEEMCLNIGTLATVYLKPVNQVFRQARTKRLADSPALQKQRVATLNAVAGHHDPLPLPSAAQPSVNGHVQQTALDQADQYFAGNMAMDVTQGMAAMHVADENLSSPVEGGGMLVNTFHGNIAPSPNMAQQDDLLL
ncbi:MAG: hypothetical protein Q9162_002453 [Coniocarpon cinnabarinum]